MPPRLALSGLRDDVCVLRFADADEVPARRILLAHSAHRTLSPPEVAMARILHEVAAAGTAVGQHRTV